MTRRAEHVRALKNELEYVRAQYPDDTRRLEAIESEISKYADEPGDDAPLETPEDGPISSARRRSRSY